MTEALDDLFSELHEAIVQAESAFKERFKLSGGITLGSGLVLSWHKHGIQWGLWISKDPDVIPVRLSSAPIEHRIEAAGQLEALRSSLSIEMGGLRERMVAAIRSVQSVAIKDMTWLTAKDEGLLELWNETHSEKKKGS